MKTFVFSFSWLRRGFAASRNPASMNTSYGCGSGLLNGLSFMSIPRKAKSYPHPNPSMIYNKVDQTFLLAGQSQTKKVPRAAKKYKTKYLLILRSQNKMEVRCFLIKLCPKIYIQSSLKGPQKCLEGCMRPASRSLAMSDDLQYYVNKRKHENE